MARATRRMTSDSPVIACTGIAVLDHVFTTPAFPMGSGKHFASGYLEVGGGPAATAAVAIARLGGTALFWGRVGDDSAGGRILAELGEWGVDVQNAKLCPDSRSPVSAVVVDDMGERMIVAFADAELDPSPDWLPLDAVAGLDAVMVDARWPQGSQCVLSAAKAHDIPSILDADATPDDAARALLPLASHVAFSSAGLAQVTGTENPAEGLARAADMTDGWVAVTAGNKGCYWRDGARLEHIPAFPVIVRDTLGAGDVFHGALALAVAESRPVEAAIRFASAAAALKCTRLGGRAGIPARADVEALLREAA